MGKGGGGGGGEEEVEGRRWKGEVEGKDKEEPYLIR